MNVLVTGASGFIGRPLARHLTAAGHQVRAMVRQASERGGLGGAASVVGDLRDRAFLGEATRDVEAVVHLAWATGVANQRLARAVNVQGTRDLLEAARRNGARRFVFVSTVSVARKRVGPYGRTKREAEALVEGSGLEWVTLRPSLVYGPGSAGLFARLARALRSLPLVPVIGSGSIEIDPVHVDDLCAVIGQCVTRQDVVGKTYDVLGPDRLTLEQLLGRLGRALGVRRPLVRIPGWVALPVAWAMGLLLTRPPLSVDNVLGMTSPARVDGAPARRDFRIAWTPIEEGLRGLDLAA